MKTLLRRLEQLEQAARIANGPLVDRWLDTLTDDEQDELAAWLERGAPIDDPTCERFEAHLQAWCRGQWEGVGS